MSAAASIVPGTNDIDKKTVVSVIVAVILIVAAILAYNYFMNKKPDGGLTAVEFEKLSAADKLLWKKSGDYYVKAA